MHNKITKKNMQNIAIDTLLKYTSDQKVAFTQAQKLSTIYQIDAVKLIYGHTPTLKLAEAVDLASQIKTLEQYSTLSNYLSFPYDPQKSISSIVHFATTYKYDGNEDGAIGKWRIAQQALSLMLKKGYDEDIALKYHNEIYDESQFDAFKAVLNHTNDLEEAINISYKFIFCLPYKFNGNFSVNVFSDLLYYTKDFEKASSLALKLGNSHTVVGIGLLTEFLEVTKDVDKAIDYAIKFTKAEQLDAFKLLHMSAEALKETLLVDSVKTTLSYYSWHSFFASLKIPSLQKENLDEKVQQALKFTDSSQVAALRVILANNQKPEDALKFKAKVYEQDRFFKKDLPNDDYEFQALKLGLIVEEALQVHDKIALECVKTHLSDNYLGCIGLANGHQGHEEM
jgi:hypothetical protein